MNKALKDIRNEETTKEFLKKLPLETLQLGIDNWDKTGAKKSTATYQASQTIEKYLCGCYVLKLCSDKSITNTKRNGFVQLCNEWLKNPSPLEDDENEMLQNLINDKPMNYSDNVNTITSYGAVVKKFELAFT